MNAFENCQSKTGDSVENCQPKPVNCGCGGEAKVQRVRTLKSHLIVVMCTKCEIATNYYTNEAEAITAWNTAMGAERKIAYDPKTKIYYPEGYVPEKLGSKNHE